MAYAKSSTYGRAVVQSESIGTALAIIGGGMFTFRGNTVMFRWILSVLITVLLAGCNVPQQEAVRPGESGWVTSAATQVPAGTVKLEFPVGKYPETGQHMKDAIQTGASPVCTIDREDAAEHRKESLDGVPTKKGYDRDEWPMAMCAEGGSGANIEYITPKDNRGAGSWVSHPLEGYPDGTRVEFVVK